MLPVYRWRYLVRAIRIPYNGKPACAKIEFNTEFVVLRHLAFGGAVERLLVIDRSLSNVAAFAEIPHTEESDHCYHERGKQIHLCIISNGNRRGGDGGLFNRYVNINWLVNGFADCCRLRRRRLCQRCRRHLRAVRQQDFRLPCQVRRDCRFLSQQVPVDREQEQERDQE